MNQSPAAKVCGEKNCLTEFSSNLPGAPGLWDEEDNCCTRSANHNSRIILTGCDKPYYQVNKLCFQDVTRLILISSSNLAPTMKTSGGAARRGLASTGKALACTTQTVKAMGFTSAT